MRLFERLSAIVLVLLAVTAYAEEGDAIAHDLTELRQQMGGPHWAGPQDFQQAVRNIAKNEPRPDRPDFDLRRTHQAHSPWGTSTTRFAPPPQSFPDIRRGQPSQHHRPAPTPVSRLRKAAFELDRLAHGLEMAELYEGADTLRETAGKLRQSARQVAIPGQDGPPMASPSPAR